MRARDYQPGEQVPGTVYRVLRLIGAGGMGTVYDVEDTTIGKRYVLKTLHPKLGAREDLARRIQHEARTLARLNHPNIVEVITAGVTTDDLRLPYYLMERLSGQSLRVVLEKKGQLELSHAYHIGIDLLDALDHAHDKGVIHRDVKPDNIFLHRTVAGITVTKLLDFGIVSMLNATSGETAGRFLGTLRYASPEQLRGDRATPKTDVYSAALVIYEIVAGRGPFDDQGDARRVAAAHLSKIPPALSRHVPGIPRELDLLIGAALAKNLDTRPRDAFSFAASLRNLKRALDGTPQRDATDSRVTAAVLTPEWTPAGDGPGPGEGSGGVDAVLSPPPGPVPVTPLPRTTIVGMPLPTDPHAALAARASPGLTPVATTTTPDGDGGALTNTMRPGLRSESGSLAASSGPASSSATLPFEAPIGKPSDAVVEAPVETPVPPIRWPPERGAVRSLEPQVRSLRVPASVQAARPRLAFVLGAVAVSAALSWVAVARHATKAPAAAAAAARQAAPQGDPPSRHPGDPAPGVEGAGLSVPAPTLAPPWLPPPADSDVAAGRTPAGSASAAPPALPTSAAPAARSPRTAPASRPAKAGGAARPVTRPGPGF